MKRDDVRPGFTLIELLVVIAVIALLASLTAPALFRNVGDARVAAARADLATISLALETYALSVGDYPSTQQGLAALVRNPGVGAAWKGPYLKGEVPRDPWGRVFQYQYPGRGVAGTYDLMTFGRDGAAGGSGEDADAVAGEAAAR